MHLRLRLSLVARMVVALAILGSISLVVAAFVTLLGGIIGFAVVAWAKDGFAVVASLPRLSTVAPVHPLVVAGGAGVAVVAVVKGWPHLRARTDVEYLLPPDTPLAAGVGAAVLVCCYLVVVEGSAAAVAAVTTLPGVLSLFLLGAAVAIWVTVAEVRRRIRDLRQRMIHDSSLLEYTDPGVATTARRLAQQADVPEPTVHVTGSERPESLTVGSGEDAIVLVSAGLLHALPDAEVEAVLAHEIAHLANGDTRVMSAALGPVLAADEWLEDDPDRLGEYVWNALFHLLKRYGQFGVAVLSRGRERAADVAAAELTGSPAALASALERLTNARRRPETDLRDWEASVAVMDILPPTERDVSTGPYRTHPPTEDRIRYLRERTAAMETES